MVVNPRASCDWIAGICVNTKHPIYTEMIGVVRTSPDIIQHLSIVPVAVGKMMPNVRPLRQEILEMVSS